MHSPPITFSEHFGGLYALAHLPTGTGVADCTNRAFVQSSTSSHETSRSHEINRLTPATFKIGPAG